MDKNPIQILIEKQPKGYAQTIASKLGITRVAVYKAIEKANLDHPVIIEMVKLAEDHQRKLRSLEERIDKIAS